VREGMLLTNNMKLTKEKLKQIIKEEYGSMFSNDTRDIADRILEDELDNTLEQIKSGMYKMRNEDAEAELIDAYDDLKEVLNYVKEVLGK
jgi:capsid portal protein